MSDWLEVLSNWLIRQAARKAPPDLSERLAEEWQADCNVRPSALSQLRFALGCCWATQVIAREHSPAIVPIAAAVLSPTTLVANVGDESGMYARRASLFFLVAGLHIALFYGLMTGLAFRIMQVMPPQSATSRIELPPPPTFLTTHSQGTMGSSDPIFQQEVLRWP
jgi:hypothetical protein